MPKCPVDNVVRVSLSGYDSVNVQYGSISPVPIHLFDGVKRAVIPPGALSYIPVQPELKGKKVRINAPFSFETGIVLVTDEVIWDSSTQGAFILVANIGIGRIPIKNGTEIGTIK